MTGEPTLFALVGLPASGKTTRARELEVSERALRLTPDEWMHPLFGDPQPGGKRDVLEGRLIWLALRALERGVSVVLDFGLWARDERSALRHLARGVGARYEIIYMDVGFAENIARLTSRPTGDEVSTFEISVDDFIGYHQSFQAPTADELSLARDAPPPPPFENWDTWAKDRWPGLLLP